MLVRVSRAKEGFADYLITGARKDSIYTREQKDRTVTLYGNLQTFKRTEKYLNKYKNYKDNYIHITISFSQKDMDALNEIEDEQKRDELFKELVLMYIKHHTTAYDLENEVIAYAEAHLPKIQLNEKNRQRFPHIHIAIAKYNPLDDTQLRTPFFNNSFLDDVLQSYVCKKYNFEIPRKDEYEKGSNDNNEKIQNEINTEDKIKSKIAVTRADWIELLKDIKTPDELLYFLENDLKLEENKDYKIAGSKTYQYIKILNLQERNKKSNSLNLNGKDFQRFILKDIKNRTFPRHKPKKELEDILSSYYKRRIDEIYKRKSRKTNEQLKEIYLIENQKTNKNVNSFRHLTYQQQLFVKHYDYLIQDTLQGYYISTNNDKVIIKNFSKNIEIIDMGEQIVTNHNSNTTSEQVKVMIEIAIAKNWELENIEPSGSDQFVHEANNQIVKLLEEKNKNNQSKKEDLEMVRIKTYTQKLKDDIQNNELNQSIDLKQLKEELDAKLVLKYAIDNFKLNASNFILTSENKIDNISNSQKPKNVIDFMQKELNLTTKEAINICQKIYESQNYNLRDNNDETTILIESRNVSKNRK